MLFEGPNGWAEWSPFLEYSDEEAAVWLNGAIEYAFGDQPVQLRDRIAVNATLPAVDASQVLATLAPFGSFRTVKIKVAEKGQTPGQDVDRIVAVKNNFPDAKIRLDANGGWSPELSFSFIKALKGQGIELEYLEQPCKSIEELAKLRGLIADAGFSVKIAADESVRRATDPLEVARAGAADILVVKAQPLGGVARALEISAEAGLPVVVSSAIDSSVGLAMGAQLAATLPELDFDCGLGTAALLADARAVEAGRWVHRCSKSRSRPNEARRIRSRRSPHRLVDRPPRPQLFAVAPSKLGLKHDQSGF
jgi:O-succinylbenzoate synthase